MNKLMAIVSVIFGFPSEQEFFIDYDFSRFNVWDEFTYKPLTAEKLKEGLIPGRWFLDHQIEMDSTWKLDNITLKFINGGAIVTKLSGLIEIKNSKLETPQLLFSKEVELNLSNSCLHGQYDELSKNTSIVIENITKASIKGVKFSTVNARAILVKDTDIYIDDCCFDTCGNRFLIGGAIAASGYNSGFSIFSGANKFNAIKTSFTNCISRLGQAIRIDSLNQGALVSCKFKQDNLNSSKVKDSENYKYYFYNSSIFADQAGSYTIISGCEFDGASIRLKDYRWYRSGNSDTTISNSKINNSVVFVDGRETGTLYMNGCENNMGHHAVRVVYDEPSQEWWNDYV